MQSVIAVENLGKKYFRHQLDRPLRLKEAVLHGFRGVKPLQSFWALRHVSFCVTHGRMLGIIGANGAGKSTLLRLVGGVGRPDEGKVMVRGRVVGMLDLGAGFHPELTGRENVFVNGVIAGLTRKEVEQRFDGIVAFAELINLVEGYDVM